MAIAYVSNFPHVVPGQQLNVLIFVCLFNKHNYYVIQQIVIFYIYYVRQGKPGIWNTCWLEHPGHRRTSSCVTSKTSGPGVWTVTVGRLA